MIATISKPKLPKGLSYVLKTSQLAKALEDGKIDCHVDLSFWVPQAPRGSRPGQSGSILEASYWLPNANVPYPRVYVRAGVSLSATRAAASQALLATGLPEFIRWLRAIVALPDGSPVLHGSPCFNAEYSESGLVVKYV